MQRKDGTTRKLILPLCITLLCGALQVWVMTASVKANEKYPTFAEPLLHLPQTNSDLFTDNHADTDILAAAERNNQIVRYENEAGALPTFETIHTVATNATQIFAIWTADIESDGDVDILFGAADDNHVGWYQNQLYKSQCYVHLNDNTLEYGNIQAAVDASSHYTDVVKVAGYCTGISYRMGTSQTVYLSKTLTIQGGYTLTNWITPDSEINPTFIDAQRQGRVLHIEGNITPTVAGLYLTGGQADGLGGTPEQNDAGGGVYIVQAAATLKDNHIENNRAHSGAGVYSYQSAAILSHNSIINNQASWDGGGSYLYESDAMRIEANIYFSNTAVASGGGIFIRKGAPIVKNNLITTNRARGGGGIFLEAYASAQLEANYILNNIADDDGGGVYMLNASPYLVNNVICKNQAIDVGGTLAGAGMQVQSDSHPTILHNTICYNLTNTAVGGAGITILYGASVTMTNSIVWGNSGGNNSQIYGPNLAATYSDIQREYAGQGNLNCDPQFINVTENDFHLQAVSCVIDNGTEIPVYTDIEGYPRPMGLTHDMGAYEYRPVSPSQIDLTGSMSGAIDVAYTFTATTLPTSSTLPITYIWQTSGESPVIHPALDSHSDTASFMWNTTGQKRVTVTAANIAGEVSTTHTIAIETAVEEVQIAGPTIGAIHIPYAFTATLDQETVLLPITYTWSPEPDSGQGSPVVTYTWTTAEQHAIYVIATNNLGSAIGQHFITLTTPPTSVTIDGPLTGIVQTAHPFTASINPSEATLFLTYTWSPPPHSGQGSSFATYIWDTPGHKQISVTATNPGGSVVGHHNLTLFTRLYLPIVLRGWPQPPGRLTLYPPEKIADGAYRIHWSETSQRFAEIYALQEARNATFTTNVITACLTTQQECTLTSRSPGTYYYRVRGHNTLGNGEWSNIESVVIPSYPIRCSVAVTTTDSAPTGNHSIDTAAIVANYIGQSLLDVAGPVPPTTSASIPTRSDFYRLDNALVNYRYTIQALPEYTNNYNLGIIVYDNSQRPIYTDTDTSTNSATISFIPNNAGPYYLEVFQVSAQCTGRTYTLIFKSPVPPTSTPIPSALPVGEHVRFLGSEKSSHLEGIVTASESRTVLYNADDEAFYPYGVFVIALMDITNNGLESDLITLSDSFKLQDEVGRKFDMAEADIQQAAKDTFDRPGAPFRIQPGFTVPMVFVFDVLPEATELHLVAVNPW
ncbi:MAG: hypothetical protein JXA21_05760 [Anaerolineae bacterium]|nr:hypothetical protein [Anaerolineae bacterium]